MTPQPTMTPQPIIPESVAMAMRFDAADNDTLFPPEVIEAATCISVKTLSKYRSEHPKMIPFKKRGRFIWYKKGDVLGYIKGSDPDETK